MSWHRIVYAEQSAFAASPERAEDSIIAAKQAAEAAIVDLADDDEEARKTAYADAYVHWLISNRRRLNEPAVRYEAQLQYVRFAGGYRRCYVELIQGDIADEEGIPEELPRLRTIFNLMTPDEFQALLAWCGDSGRGRRMKIQQRLISRAIFAATGNELALDLADAAMAEVADNDDDDAEIAGRPQEEEEEAVSSRAPVAERAPAVELPRPRARADVAPSVERQAQLAALCASCTIISPEALVVRLRRVLADAEADVAAKRARHHE